MKKYIILFFLFFLLKNTNAIDIDAEINTETVNNCIATTDNQNYICNNIESNNYFDNYDIVFDSQGNFLYYGSLIIGHITKIISSDKYDVLIHQYTIQPYYGGGLGGISIFNKITKEIDESYNFYENPLTGSGFYGYQIIENGHIRIFTADSTVGWQSLDLYQSTYTLSNIQPNGYLNINQNKTQLYSNYLIYLNNLTNLLNIKILNTNYELPGNVVESYVYKDGFLTLGGFSYNDTGNWDTQLLSGGVIDGNFNLEILYQTGGLITDVTTDNYFISKNIDTNLISSNIHSPVFTISGDDLYYINFSGTLSKISKENISLIGGDYLPNTGGESGTGIIDYNQCRLDVDNDGDVEILNGEFFVGLYNCFSYGIDSINNGFSSIYDLTNTVKNIGNTTEDKTFFGFIFGIKKANASMMESFNNRAENNETGSIKVLDFIIYGFYTFMVLGALIFFIQLKK